MTKITLLSPSNPNSNPKHYLTLELSIASERLRQAHHSFNLALVTTTVSFCISVIGAGLLLSGKVPEGTVTTASGLASSVLCIQLARDTSEKLDKVLVEFKEEDS